MFVLEKESLDKPCYLEPDDHTNSQVAVFFFSWMIANYMRNASGSGSLVKYGKWLNLRP